MFNLVEHRGISKETNEYIYGYLIGGKFNDSNRTDMYITQGVGGNCIEVYSDSIGIYTGLSNEDGKIYQGDILKIELPCGGFWGNIKQEKIGKVLYEPECGGFKVEWNYSKNQHHVLLTCDIAIDSKTINIEKIK